LLDIPD
jgi:hypothetical protein